MIRFFLRRLFPTVKPRMMKALIVGGGSGGLSFRKIAQVGSGVPSYLIMGKDEQ